MALAAVQGTAWAGWWWIWWVVWVVIIILALVWWTPLGGRTRMYRETPLEVLRRRLANGEITTQEYEEKRALLLRDHGQRGPRGGQAAWAAHRARRARHQRGGAPRRAIVAKRPAPSSRRVAPGEA